MEDWDHATLASIDWALGAAMLIRREAAQKTKLLDERFFLYFEDVDLCLGMHQRGWRVLYDPAACMIHHHRRDSANFLSWRAKQRHCWSLAQFLLKHRFLLGAAK
jgi:N-acetylglucosaminyl-diphospho-decaprenol L-rhamnosyltransferase